jgi:uncharacterized HAD superfamily protein
MVKCNLVFISHLAHPVPVYDVKHFL